MPSCCFQTAFRPRMPAAESVLLQKQKECHKKQAVAAKALRKQELDGSTAAAAPAQLPKRPFRTKASNSWKLTEFDFWC